MTEPRARVDRGPLEWLLSPFADLRRGEGVAVVLLGSNVFVLLLAYYLLKVTREALITPLDGGPRLKAAAAAGMALLLIPLLRLFDRLSERVGRMGLITVTTLAFGVALLALGVTANVVRHGAPLAVGFFIFVGIFNMFIIAQFWAFANDLYSESEGKRLFGVIAVGSAVGGIVGAQVAKRLFDASAEGRLMFAAAALLLVALGLSWAANVRERQRRGAAPALAAKTRSDQSSSAPVDQRSSAPTDQSSSAPTDQSSSAPTVEEPALAAGSGWAMLARRRYFVLIAAMLVVYNCVNSVGEFVLSSEVKRAALASGQPAAEYIASFTGDFFSVVNLVSLLLQLFVVSRVLKYAGVRVALFVMPLVALGGYVAIGAVMSLLVIRIAKTAENSLDYSLQNTARQALWLVVTREEKYKVKALVDTFFVRLGDVAAFGVITLGLDVLHLSTRGFAMTNVVLVVLWLAIAWGITREHRRRAALAAGPVPR